jgi:hypothetical protein
VSLINVSLNLVAYADQTATFNPNVKYSDLRWSLLGLPTDNERTVPIRLSPGETATVMSTQRTLSFTTGTSFMVVQLAGTSNVQLQASFGQRVARSAGDGTTQWAITLVNQLMTITWTGTGTAPSFGGMVAGDGITISSPFNVLNQGDFTIVKVGSNFVSVVNGLAQAETVIGQMDIYSSGPVQVGDILDLTSSQFSYPNRGQFILTRVTDQFVQFVNPNAVPETVTGVLSTDLNIYPEYQEWMLIAVDGSVVVRLNNDIGNGNVIDPIAQGDIVNTPGLFLKRGKVFRVDLVNPGLIEVNGTMFLSG